MWPYWLMFAVPAAAALSNRDSSTWPAARTHKLTTGWAFAVAALTILIGYRFEVGGDWTSYLLYAERARSLELRDVAQLSDPGYQLINWFSVQFGGDIFAVNLLSGALFSAGLAAFCRSLPRPWLALAVAVPYLVIVVAMGYTRQGIALGLAMLGLNALAQRRTRAFVFWVVAGATFHKTAVLLLPIAALASTRNRYWTAAWVGIVGLGAYALLLADSAETLYVNYVEAQYQSQGAMIRLIMNALPAAIVLTWWRRFRFADGEAALWRWVSILSLVLLAVLLLTPASTAVDRMALYFLPLQLVVFSHLPDVFGRRGKRNNGAVALVLSYYAAVLFVWLNFATHAFAWVPYRFYPLEGWL